MEARLLAQTPVSFWLTAESMLQSFRGNPTLALAPRFISKRLDHQGPRQNVVIPMIQLTHHEAVHTIVRVINDCQVSPGTLLCNMSFPPFDVAGTKQSGAVANERRQKQFPLLSPPIPVLSASPSFRVTEDACV